MEDGIQMINIIYEDNHLLVVEKPINMLVQADNTHDKDLLTILKEYLKEKYQKTGNVYLGLVHRLDRPVGGVMVFAKTSKCASRLSKQIREHKLVKEYCAIIMGKLEHNKGTFKDKLLKDTKNNLSFVSNDGKDSELDYEVVSYKEGLSLVKINLKTGRHHQIRVQFSSRGYPLYGDHKYNINCNLKEQLALFASSLTINHPITNESVTFKLPIPKFYPWSIFNE